MCNSTDVVFCSQVVPTPIVYMLGMELLMGACYLLGAVIYSNAVPEKWRPGMFDVWGHSHNIFHVLVVCGAYIHYKVSLFLVIFGYFVYFGYFGYRIRMGNYTDTCVLSNSHRRRSC